MTGPPGPGLAGPACGGDRRSRGATRRPPFFFSPLSPALALAVGEPPPPVCSRTRAHAPAPPARLSPCPQVEEISAAESHKKANTKKEDPLEVRKEKEGREELGRGGAGERGLGGGSGENPTTRPSLTPLSPLSPFHAQTFCNDNPDADECRVYED